jgi:hypothetical protein
MENQPQATADNEKIEWGKVRQLVRESIDKAIDAPNPLDTPSLATLAGNIAKALPRSDNRTGKQFANVVWTEVMIKVLTLTDPARFERASDFVVELDKVVVTPDRPNHSNAQDDEQEEAALPEYAMVLVSAWYHAVKRLYWKSGTCCQRPQGCVNLTANTAHSAHCSSQHSNKCLAPHKGRDATREDIESRCQDFIAAHKFLATIAAKLTRENTELAEHIRHLAIRKAALSLYCSVEFTPWDKESPTENSNFSCLVELKDFKMPAFAEEILRIPVDLEPEDKEETLRLWIPAAEVFLIHCAEWLFDQTIRKAEEFEKMPWDTLPIILFDNLNGEPGWTGDRWNFWKGAFEKHGEDSSRHGSVQRRVLNTSRRSWKLGPRNPSSKAS